MKRVILGVGIVTVAAATGVACSSSSSTPASPNGGDDGGSSSSGSSSGTSSSSGSSSGTSSSSGSSSGGADASTTLYMTLGGHAGVRGAVNAIVAAELGDPIIASYFFNQTMAIPGHPNPAQIEECFTDLVAANIGGTEKYPTTVGPFNDAGVSVGDGGPSDAGGTWTCRDMTTIHQPLKISGAVFDKFVTIAAGVLTAPPYSLSTTSSAFTTLAGLLTGTKSAIVDSNIPADAGAAAFSDAAP